MWNSLNDGVVGIPHIQCHIGPCKTFNVGHIQIAFAVCVITSNKMNCEPYEMAISCQEELESTEVLVFGNTLPKSLVKLISS